MGKIWVCRCRTPIFVSSDASIFDELGYSNLGDIVVSVSYGNIDQEYTKVLSKFGIGYTYLDYYNKF
jgi:hypothetical protein